MNQSSKLTLGYNFKLIGFESIRPFVQLDNMIIRDQSSDRK